MLYPIAIELDNNLSDYSVSVMVPDLPGCFSAGNSVDDALVNVREAIEGHIELIVDDGENIPSGAHIQDYIHNPDYKGCVWALIDVDITKLLKRTEKVTITLPALLITKIDEMVQKRPELGANRSAFLAEAANAQLFKYSR